MNSPLFLDYLIIGFAILMPTGVYKFIIREKYAQQLLGRSDIQRSKVFNSTGTLLKMLKLFLYLSPLIVFLLPYWLYQFGQVDLLKAITCTVLLLITVGLEYIFRRWLFNRLRSTTP